MEMQAGARERVAAAAAASQYSRTQMLGLLVTPRWDCGSPPGFYIAVLYGDRPRRKREFESVASDPVAVGGTDRRDRHCLGDDQRTRNHDVHSEVTNWGGTKVGSLGARIFVYGRRLLGGCHVTRRRASSGHPALSNTLKGQGAMSAVALEVKVVGSAISRPVSRCATVSFSGCAKADGVKEW